MACVDDGIVMQDYAGSLGGHLHGESDVEEQAVVAGGHMHRLQQHRPCDFQLGGIIVRASQIQLQRRVAAMEVLS